VRTLARIKLCTCQIQVVLKKGQVIAGIAIGVAVAYFAITAAVLPNAYLLTLNAPKPGPIVTAVSISKNTTKLGESFTVRVNATNQGDHADRQIVSVAFPNLTRTEGIVNVQEENFKQSPTFIKVGQKVGFGYAGTQQTVQTRYPSVEIFSSPWQKGESFNMVLSIKPDHEGKFVFLVKAVGLPHNGDQAHWPSGGLLDQQNEYVRAYSVNVTKA
jgi:hypothetical protein